MVRNNILSYNDGSELCVQQVRTLGGGGFGGFGRTAHSVVEASPRGVHAISAWRLATLHGHSKWSGGGRVQVGPITL